MNNATKKSQNHKENTEELGVVIVNPKLSDIGSRLSRKFSVKSLSDNNNSNTTTTSLNKPEIRFRVDSNTSTTEESDFEELNNDVFHKLAFEKYQSGTFKQAKETLEGQLSIDSFPSRKYEKYHIGQDKFIDIGDNQNNPDLSTSTTIQCVWHFTYICCLFWKEKKSFILKFYF